MRYFVYFVLTIFTILLWQNNHVLAADDLVIHSFHSDITLSTDDSLDITEKLSVDFDHLAGKHGIFRIVPYINGRVEKENRNAVITLKSITDDSGDSYQYQTITNTSDRTITWKIGNANKTISGIHQYTIHYLVQNVVGVAHDAENQGKDELIWNLNGNFWEISTDAYQADIHFPPTITKDLAAVTLYSGNQGTANNTLADFTWTSPTDLHVTSKGGLSPGEGITLSTVFPTGIVTPSNVPPPAPENSGASRYVTLFAGAGLVLFLLGLLCPLIVLVVCFRLWSAYGKDAKIDGSIAPEFAPPGDLRPFELGLIDSMGKLEKQFVAATIVDLAVRGYIKVEEVPKQFFFSKKDWKLTFLKNNTTKLKPFEVKIYDTLRLGADQDETKGADDLPTKSGLLSDIGKGLVTEREKLQTIGRDSLADTGYLDKNANAYTKRLATWAIVSAIVGFILFFLFFTIGLAIGCIISAAIFAIFASIMPKRTDEGLQIERQIRGFQLYMKTAETYRQQFFEKENIFEKLLPYAIAFNLTTQWTKAVQTLSPEYVHSYVPLWYVGGSSTVFAMDSFSSNLNSLSSSISAAMTPSSSGSGGSGGFSGGGGGGGGGGGW